MKYYIISEEKIEGIKYFRFSDTPNTFRAGKQAILSKAQKIDLDEAVDSWLKHHPVGQKFSNFLKSKGEENGILGSNNKR